MSAAARGLHKCPDFAKKVGIPAEALVELLHQRMAVAGDTGVLQMIVQRADSCWYAVTNAAQQDLRRVLAWIEQVTGPPATRDATQVAIAALFERALRLHRAGLAGKKLDNADQEPKHEVATPAPSAEERMKKKQLVMQMLADLRAGKGPRLDLPQTPPGGTPSTPQPPK